jgi:DNA polymerase elongation subunit (family B)
MNEAKILTIDIETSPSLAYIWSLWDDSIPLARLVEEGIVICFAAKWLHKKSTMFYSLANDGKEAMIQAAWDLLNEADIVVGFNHKNFDLRHLNREFLMAGLGSPSHYANLDILTIVRNKFKFVSNKLEHVAVQLGVGKKMKNSGFDLWVSCMAGTLIPGVDVDWDAWKEMEKYNKQDVRVTEAAYLKVRSWDTSNVHLGAYGGNEDCCRVCGGKDLEKRGYKVKGASVFQQYQCKDVECRAWSRSAKAIKNQPKPTTRAI